MHHSKGLQYLTKFKTKERKQKENDGEDYLLIFHVFHVHCFHRPVLHIVQTNAYLYPRRSMESLQCNL